MVKIEYSYIEKDRIKVVSKICANKDEAYAELQMKHIMDIWCFEEDNSQAATKYTDNKDYDKNGY